MVLQFFHQTNLSFLFYWFVSRTVFTYTECIVSPDELHRHFHQSSHTYCWFHIIREYKEGSTSRDYTSVQCHTDTATSHSQFSYTSLQESTGKVTFRKGMCFL